ncbi:MAG: membrane protein insertase YidC, partial [Planctomycetaceae bacterium]|nr:membrane protein insertase YidC [Planctomycetaceae bacterium]
MENRRFFIFLMVSMAFILIWTKLMPPKPPVRKPDAVVVDEQAENAPDENANADGPAGDAKAADPNAEVVPAFPDETVTIGSLKPEDHFALAAELTSQGASIRSVRLSSPQFRDLEDRNEQARIIGNNGTADHSLSTAVEFIDEKLKAHGQSLETANWQVVQKKLEGTEHTVVFAYEFARLRLTKTYRLTKMNVEGDDLKTAWAEDPNGYFIHVRLEIQNLADQPRTIVYEMAGPVGILLENEEHTRKYRDVKAEFASNSSAVSMAASTLSKTVGKIEAEQGVLSRPQLDAQLREKEKWTEPVRYAAVDVQFFAAVLSPVTSPKAVAPPAEEETATQQDDAEQPPATSGIGRWVESVYPVMIERNVEDRSRSDISFRMRSSPVDLGTEDDNRSLSHDYAFFVGPKRGSLLDPPPMEASRVLDYGTYFGFVARFMHSMLEMFYRIGMPCFLAIITLTILVRGCLFPISRKQAISAAKMKDLQPKIQELKEKYGDDREKMARAQMELWRKHGVNPMAGCLPLLLQMPIFIGLYTALNTAVDLRLSRFLWIDNLAAPDAILRLPFELPFLGQDFNLLPCLTVALFMIQQKLFMPPATDEQQEMQHKMMNMMTLMFGFMFWHQPAGLCLYFIASSCWGIAERKLLAKTTGKPSDTPA